MRQRIPHVKELAQAQATELPAFFGYLGMTVVATGTDEVSVRMTVPEGLYSPYGMVHGGAVAALIDTAFGIVVACQLQPGSRTATHELNINYISFSRGPTLLCRARVLRLGSAVASVEGEVISEAGGALVAKALGTFGVFRPRAKK
jgi:acyl-CoA thioesterase